MATTTIAQLSKLFRLPDIAACSLLYPAAHGNIANVISVVFSIFGKEEFAGTSVNNTLIPLSALGPQAAAADPQILAAQPDTGY